MQGAEEIAGQKRFAPVQQADGELHDLSGKAGVDGLVATRHHGSRRGWQG